MVDAVSRGRCSARAGCHVSPPRLYMGLAPGSSAKMNEPRAAVEPCFPAPCNVAGWAHGRPASRCGGTVRYAAGRSLRSFFYPALCPFAVSPPTPAALSSPRKAAKSSPPIPLLIVSSRLIRPSKPATKTPVPPVPLHEMPLIFRNGL